MQSSGAIDHALKIPLVAIAVFAIAMALAACGGDDDSASTDTSTPAQAASSADAEEPGGKSAENAPSQGGGSSSGGQNGGSSKSSQAGGSETVSEKPGASGKGSVSQNKGFRPAPLKVSGGGSDQFVQKGGDNSIQEFGEEGSDAELQQAAEATHSFYVARLKSEWELACSYMSNSMIEKLQKLVENSPEGKNANCAKALELFTAPAPDYISRAITEVDAGSFRHESDDQGFLLYYGYEHETYAMPMNQKDGQWKVSALAAVQLSS